MASAPIRGRRVRGVQTSGGREASQPAGQKSQSDIAEPPPAAYDAHAPAVLRLAFSLDDPASARPGMKTQRLESRFFAMLELAAQLCRQTEAGYLLVLVERPADWQRMQQEAGDVQLVIAADRPDELEGAAEAGLPTILLNMPNAPVIERLTQALLTGVAREVLAPGARVVVVYSGFEADTIDSISFIELDEHLGRLTARDLKQLETSVPLETLKTVIDLAVEIGREGREGKPVGTMFVVGDTRRVLPHCQPAGFDPVRGYSRNERDLHDPRVREAIKEVAVLDGAFIVSAEGIVEKAAQLVDAPYANLTLSKGLGARHWAGAAISKVTSALAIVVSQSSGTVRLFQRGEVVLRIEPLRHAMKWKDFDYEPPPPAETD
jgi:diadenylate cyclase